MASNLCFKNSLGWTVTWWTVTAGVNVGIHHVFAWEVAQQQVKVGDHSDH